MESFQAATSSEAVSQLPDKGVLLLTDGVPQPCKGDGAVFCPRFRGYVPMYVHIMYIHAFREAPPRE